VKPSTARRSLVAVIIAAASLPGGARAQDAPAAPPPDAVAAVGASEAIADEWTHWANGRYRVTPGDVLEFSFPFVPELNQIVTVQPDGFLTLKDIPDLRVQGRTVAQVKADVLDAYAAFVREPKFTITLKEFEKPYFVIDGEVNKPARYELRGATTLTQALAMAGGTKAGANRSNIVLYRRFGEDGIEAKQINVARMHSKRDLSEDPLLRPGDTIVVPRSMLGKVLPILDVVR
jgi:polysaccharide export outer membrane protein